MDGKRYYLIKMQDAKSEYKSWLGWSNSNGSLGFYYTNNKVCKIFSEDVISQDKDLIRYLEDKIYELVPIDNIEEIRQSRIYF